MPAWESSSLFRPDERSSFVTGFVTIFLLRAYLLFVLNYQSFSASSVRMFGHVWRAARPPQRCATGALVFPFGWAVALRKRSTPSLSRCMDTLRLAVRRGLWLARGPCVAALPFSATQPSYADHSVTFCFRPCVSVVVLLRARREKRFGAPLASAHTAAVSSSFSRPLRCPRSEGNARAAAALVVCVCVCARVCVCASLRDFLPFVQSTGAAAGSFGARWQSASALTDCNAHHASKDAADYSRALWSRPAPHPSPPPPLHRVIQASSSSDMPGGPVGLKRCGRPYMQAKHFFSYPCHTGAPKVVGTRVILLLKRAAALKRRWPFVSDIFAG